MEKKTAVGYIRVSTENQVENGQGLEIQEKQIRDYCNKNNIELLEVFRDEGISGAKSILERQGLGDAVLYCKQEKPNMFLIPKYDRLARDLLHQMTIEGKLIELGVELISVLEPTLNGNDPMRTMMRQMIGMMAQYERSLIKSRTHSGCVATAEKGKKTGGSIPYGYKTVRDRDGKNPKAVIVPEQAEIIKEIYNLYVKEQYGFQVIANILNSRNIPTAKNSKWLAGTIQKILHNDYYMGMLNYGDIKVKGEHKPIISEKMFNMAQEVVIRQRPRNYKLTNDNDNEKINQEIF